MSSMGRAYRWLGILDGRGVAGAGRRNVEEVAVIGVVPPVNGGVGSPYIGDDVDGRDVNIFGRDGFEMTFSGESEHRM